MLVARLVGETKARFEKCRFVIDSGWPGIRPTGPLVELAGKVAVDGETEVVMRDCWFDSRAETAVRAVNCGTAILIGNDYGGTREAVLCGASESKRARVLIDGGRFERVTGGALGVIADGPLNANSKLTLTGTWNGVLRPLSGDPAAIEQANIASTRVMPMAALPAAGLAGDVVQLMSPPPGAPDCYRCTASSAVAAQWRLTTQAGVLRGRPARRPTLGGEDAGTLYLDTGLSEAGKPIWWTGEHWVDAAGRAV